MNVWWEKGAYVASKYLLQGTYNYDGKVNNFQVEKPRLYLHQIPEVNITSSKMNIFTYLLIGCMEKHTQLADNPSPRAQSVSDHMETS